MSNTEVDITSEIVAMFGGDEAEPPPTEGANSEDAADDQDSAEGEGDSEGAEDVASDAADDKESSKADDDGEPEWSLQQILDHEGDWAPEEIEQAAARLRSEARQANRFWAVNKRKRESLENERARVKQERTHHETRVQALDAHLKQLDSGDATSMLRALEALTRRSGSVVVEQLQQALLGELPSGASETRETRELRERLEKIESEKAAQTTQAQQLQAVRQGFEGALKQSDRWPNLTETAKEDPEAVDFLVGEMRRMLSDGRKLVDVQAVCDTVELRLLQRAQSAPRSGGEKKTASRRQATRHVAAGGAARPRETPIWERDDVTPEETTEAIAKLLGG